VKKQTATMVKQLFPKLTETEGCYIKSLIAPPCLRYPDTRTSCCVGIAIRIGYGDTPIRCRYGIGRYRGKREIQLISILLNTPPILHLTPPIPCLCCSLKPKRHHSTVTLAVVAAASLSRSGCHLLGAWGEK
jgi:hypothetical protein